MYQVIAIDLHAAQIQGFFDKPIDNFPAAPMLADYFLSEKDLSNVVVSPDHGVTQQECLQRCLIRL